MLFLVAALLFLSAPVFGNSCWDSPQELTMPNLVQGIGAGITTVAVIQCAVANEYITQAQGQNLAGGLAQAGGASGGGNADQCPIPTAAAAAADPFRHTTPLINTIIGYANPCSTPSQDYFDNDVVPTGIPNLSGTYTNDVTGCQLRIVQSGEEIIFIVAGVVHHFKREAENCPLLCRDFKSACVGQSVLGLGAECIAIAHAVHHSDPANCWILHAGPAQVRWCKSGNVVSRTVTVGGVSMPAQTFTQVSRRKQ